MPRINRIRIVNFSYNNDSRHIIDETFNFHGGENALLNLANGGGKSVLVQLILQPVVPEVRIQGRHVADFFRKAKLPAYVMIEWKLDGAGGYLLTGIGIAPAQTTGTDETRHRIRYFTFTSKYTSSNAFDVAHIPVVSRTGVVLDVLPLREARNLIADREKKDPYSVRCFAEDDGERYGRYLAEFGIAQEEWRTVITKINDSEGGLEEIFHKCKTGGQLLNDWIITTVEKAMFRNKSEFRRLEEMLTNLVDEVIENERFILEKQLFDGFLVSFREQVEGLAGLLRGIDNQKTLAGRLLALHAHLSVAATALHERLEQGKQEIEECRAVEHRVRLEERSHAYWTGHSEYKDASGRLRAVELSLGETQKSLQAAELRRVVISAAGLAAEINRISSELSGVEEGLTAAREGYDTDTRLRSLEYSLRIKYAQILDSLAKDLDDLKVKKAVWENQDEKISTDLKAVDQEKAALDGQKGTLEERTRSFKQRESETLRRLGITLVRNLLGGLDATEIRNIRATMEKTLDALRQRLESREHEKSTGAARIQTIDDELKENLSVLNSEKAQLRDHDRYIAEYEQKELEIKRILAKYEFSPTKLFEREHLSAGFERLVQDLEARVAQSTRERNDLWESVTSLKDGRLHVSLEMASQLAGLDIEYETGEAYLQKLEPTSRRRMLESNPVLPFTFIVTKTELKRLAASLHGVPMRRAIPFIAYEDLRTTVPVDGCLAQAGQVIALSCLYEERVFDSGSLTLLMEELERNADRVADQCDHLTAELRRVLSDRLVVADFKYDADHRYVLGLRKKESEQRCRELASSIALLEDERQNLLERLQGIDQDIAGLRTSRQKAAADWADFTGLVEQEPAYQECRQHLTEVMERIGGLEDQKGQLTSNRESLRREIGSSERRIWRCEQDQEKTQLSYDVYRDSPEAQVVEGTAEELEARQKALKEQYGGEIHLLEERRKDLTRDSTRKKKELLKLGLEEQEYAGADYDESTAEAVIGEISGWRNLQAELRKEELAASRQEGAAKKALDIALAEVLSLGAPAPLQPEDIRGDFDGRRKKARLRVRELEDTTRTISREIHGYETARETIGQLVEYGSTQPEPGFIPEQDVLGQVAGLTKEFTQIKRDNAVLAGNLRNEYNQLRMDYREKNINLDNIFRGLDALWSKTDMEFDGFYYLYEHMSVHAEKLTELVALYEAQLGNLERNKADMVQQSFMHAVRLYEEIELISDNSRVRLKGRNRLVQMLKIDLDLDNKDAARHRMKDYIEQCIDKVRAETRKEKKENEVRRIVTNLMSSRELLDIFLGNSNIPISVFKIEMNMSNSRLMRWEEAIRNSGGEKFVVFFSVLSALTAYTRARAMDAAGVDADTDTRVLVMDNPFGPISSEHLLSPLFDIAERHRTQLICLSDLKQNSIMNCFNLIYMLKVRSSVIGDQEYLKFEEIIRDEDAVKNDEKLEKADFRAADAKQISLFDDPDA